MNRRMMGQEKSLNDPIKSGETEEWQDWLVDERLDQNYFFLKNRNTMIRKIVRRRMKILNEREKEIIIARRLTENPITLEELSKKYKISRSV